MFRTAEPLSTRPPADGGPTAPADGGPRTFPPLDPPAAVQRRDQALRLLEAVPAGEATEPVREIRELEEAVSGLWISAVARYVSLDSIDGLDAGAARIVREACASSTIVVVPSGTAAPLLAVEHAHRLAVAIPGLGALLVEVADEQLDPTAVAAAAAMARLYALVEGERRVEVAREIRRGLAAAIERARRAQPPTLPPVA
jgi:hypothetical protein